MPRSIRDYEPRDSLRQARGAPSNTAGVDAKWRLAGRFNLYTLTDEYCLPADSPRETEMPSSRSMLRMSLRGLLRGIAALVVLSGCYSQQAASGYVRDGKKGRVCVGE